MNPAPFISVVTPVYRTGALLLEAFESLKQQGNIAFEWILVNDGSSDEPTLSALQAIEQQAPFPVHVYHLENGGACRARNYGLSKASGAYVKFFDGDDLLEPRALEIQGTLAQEHMGKVVGSPCKQIRIDANGEHQQLSHNLLKKVPDDLFGAMLGRSIVNHSAQLFPVELARKVGGYDESLKADQDGDFLLRVFWEKPGLVYTPEGALLYRQHEITNRISRNNDPKKIQSRYAVYLKVRRQLEENDLFEKYHKQLAAKLYDVATRAAQYDLRQAQAYYKEALEIYPGLRLHPKSHIHWFKKLAGFSLVHRLRDLLRKSR